MAMKNLGRVASELFPDETIDVTAFDGADLPSGAHLKCITRENSQAYIDLDLKGTKELIALLQEAVKFAEQGHHPSNRDTTE